jgi:signal transduction histidine kinase
LAGGATFSKSSIALLFTVLSIGILLSIVSYQYSSFTANEISKMASEDVRDNARIKVYDLSQILVHSIDSVDKNLRSLKNSPAIFNNNVGEVSQALIDAAQDSTKQLSDGYFWLDSAGKLLKLSTSNGLLYKSYTGMDHSKKDYFLMPLKTHTAYYSSTIESSDKIPRLYISFPVISNSPTLNITTESTKEIRGVVVAAVRVDSIGEFLQRELTSNYISSLGLMDRDGVFLFARNESLIGKNYLSAEFQSTIPISIKESYNAILKKSLENKAGAEDITFHGNTTTIAYQPVIINGKLLWTLYIGSPHRLATNVGLVIDQQKNFSTLMVIIIGAVAFVVAFLILSWNKRLEAAVGTRTKELKRANDSLTESNKLLAEANDQLKVHDRMQKEFINIAAHELRTPIMPILGDAEFLEHHFNDQANIVQVEKEQISSIIRNAKRLDRLAQDILDVTKIESKTLKLNKETFSLSSVITDVVQDAVQLIADSEVKSRKDLRISSKCDENISVYADKSRITQVVANLLSNAIKFTEEGYVIVEAFKQKGMIIVSVKDSGSGIDQEILPRLFSKFTTQSDVGGTGLGLFISKSIVEAHLGTIWAVNNANEKGATFFFTIPI